MKKIISSFINQKNNPSVASSHGRIITSYKNLFFYCIALFALSNWHCSDKLEGFDLVYRHDFPRDIPASASSILSHNFIIENIQSNVKNFYANNAATENDVLKIIPRFAKITAKFGDADFIFVDRIFVYVYPVGQPNKKIEVFYLEQVPARVGSALTLNSGIADVKSIIGGEQFSMEVRLDVRGQPSRNIETQIDFSFYAVTKE